MSKPRTGCCSRKICGAVLTKDNAKPAVLELGYGYCRSCSNARLRFWRNKNRKRVLPNQRKYQEENKEARKGYGAKFARTLKGRHNSLKKKMRKEGVLGTDLLWNLNYYSSLVEGSPCHYCLGPLEPAGHGLDRVDNSKDHVWDNVIPCCRSCNRKKWDDTSYEEMMLLVPAIREIRRRRELVIGD